MQHWASPQQALKPKEDEMDVFVEDGSVIGQDGGQWKDEAEEAEGGDSKEQDGVELDKKVTVKRDTKAKAQRLYESWSTLIPNLPITFLAYMNKWIGKPTCTSFDTSPCQNCNPSLGTSTQIICLFWDSKYYNTFLFAT